MMQWIRRILSIVCWHNSLSMFVNSQHKTSNLQKTVPYILHSTPHIISLYSTLLIIQYPSIWNSHAHSNNFKENLSFL
jgi:hypothetical protein